MRIIKCNDNEKARVFAEKFKDFFKKYGKRTAAITTGVLIIGGAVALNFILPKTANADQSTKTDNQQTLKQQEDFFAASALNRTKARDEAVEALQSVVDTGGDEAAAKQALADITRISADIEKEANIETLIKAKGFEDCIAVISGESLSIVVKSAEQLLPNEVAQIKEIAYKSADVLPDNVVITLKK